MTAAVSLRSVGKSFAGKTVVGDVNLDIAAGEFIVLVGPSGCGKSTTLRMVAGLEQITAGEIAIDGRVINTLAPKERGVAMVFQNYALYPHLSVFENIAFGLRLAKQPRESIDQAVNSAAQILGLNALLERKPAELSGGQRQRVAMGRAIVRQPKVFLFDEPLSNLDAKLRNTMRAEIKRLHQRLGSTVIYVTHDQVEAMTLADRIVVMRDGHIEQIGTPEQLYDEPANTFVAAFMGSPPMNLLAGRIGNGGASRLELGDGQSLPLADAVARSLPRGAAVTVGMRPEKLVLGPAEGMSFQAQIELVEVLGGETVLHAKLGEQTLLVRTAGRPSLNSGDSVRLTVNAQDLFLFDGDSGRRLA
jgi:multiple sugar transport system ATP-binding protein